MCVFLVICCSNAPVILYVDSVILLVFFKRFIFCNSLNQTWLSYI